MTKLEIDWPDAAAERVRASKERLVLAGEALRARRFEDRLEVARAVLADWTTADSPWRRELADALEDATDFTAATLREGLDAGLGAWDPDAFVACAQREIGAPLASKRVQLAPFSWTTVLTGGAIPMPTILSALLPLVLGSPVLLRETSKDPVTASILKRSLAARDDDLARAFEPIAVPADDAAAFEVALEAPCIVATGSDETLESIARRLAPTQRLVRHGHRFSVAALGRAVLRDGGTLTAAAKGIALDVARWDQSGCLSPVVVYLVGLDAAERRSVAEEIARALDELSVEMPRGRITKDQAIAISNECSEARMRIDSEVGMLFAAPDHSVILEVDAQPRPAPLGRFLRLMPVDSEDRLIRALTPFSGHLANIALAGFEANSTPDIHSATSPIRDESILERLASLGVSRFTQPGRLQTPPVDWPHDGHGLFAPLSRFTQSDSIGL